jgi:hypothetical protein
MIVHKESHTDHGVQIHELLELFKDRKEFFIETIRVKEAVECRLVGPATGHVPVPEENVFYNNRGDREYKSRMTDKYPTFYTHEVTVIAGPHDGHDCILYTAFAGPLSPKEPTDPTLTEEEKEKSEKFWSKHALII